MFNKYEKVCSNLAKENFNEIIPLTLKELIDIHDDGIFKYGGSYGIRDKGLLESICISPYQTIFEEELYPTIYDKAAKLLTDFCKYQVFVDGNKRTGVMVAEEFLNKNGFTLTFTDIEYYQLAMDIATSREPDLENIANRIKTHVDFIELEK